jgi:hypothetical protein
MDVLVVHEKALQSNVETATLTHAGFGDRNLFKDTEDKPQLAHLIALRDQGRTAGLALSFPVLLAACRVFALEGALH